MKRFILFMMVGLVCLEAKIPVLSYKKLIKSNYTDHAIPFKEFFACHRPKNLVELGLGIGTINFIRNCDNVLSVEFIEPNFSDNWYNDCLKAFNKFSHWKAVTIDLRERKELMEANDTCLEFYGDPSKPYLADYLAGRKPSTTLYNPIKMEGFLSEIDNLVGEVVQISQDHFGEEVEAVFVDCGLICRADLVNALFQKVPIIAVHDTSTAGTFFLGYGYDRMKAPDNYRRFEFKKRAGTTFFIRDDYQELIEKMEIVQKEKFDV